MTAPMAETMSPREVVEDALHEKLSRAFRANIYDHPHKSLTASDEHTCDLFAGVAAEALASSGDHAELAVQSEVDEFAGKALDWEIIAGSWKDRAEGVLAENAALKAERDALNDYGRDVAKEAVEYRSKLAEARGLLSIVDQHMGEDDHLWTDGSTIATEWMDGPIRRSLTFGLFRQIRAFLAPSADQPEAEGA